MKREMRVNNKKTIMSVQKNNNTSHIITRRELYFKGIPHPPKLLSFFSCPFDFRFIDVITSVTFIDILPAETFVIRDEATRNVKSLLDRLLPSLYDIYIIIYILHDVAK